MKFPRRENKTDDNGPSNFLKIKDGESVAGVLRGELYRFYQKGFGQTSQIVGPDDGGKERFRHNIAVKEGNAFVIKVWEFGVKIYDDLYALENGGWDLTATTITISRKGTTKENTKYTVTPMKAPPTATSMKEIEKLNLQILEHQVRPAEEADANNPEGLPF